MTGHTQLCPYCKTEFPATKGRVTCGKPECHEQLVANMISAFGEFKKIIRIRSGEAFRVPVRDIIEKGVNERDLDQYPRWDEKA